MMMMNCSVTVKPFYGDEMPIAAIATAVAISALALVRLSGKATIALLSKVFSRPKALLAAQGNTIVYGWILAEDGQKIDEVLIAVYRAPQSYTGEESAEITCHGGFNAVHAVMQTLIKAGFREALPGEFTFRAFINGKIDLTRAESVMELVGAKTDEGREHALTRLSGSLEAEIRLINNDLVAALAETELNLDYSELDGVGDESGDLPARDKIESALAQLERLAETYTYEKLYREGALVVLAGPPNAGKSSLFNRLVNEDRSIVTDIPGTTRDWLEAWISLKGIPIRLIDTAGLRDSSEKIEKIGIERSRKLLQDADLVLFIADGMDFEGFDWNETRQIDKQKMLLLWNKADIAQNPPLQDFLPVSAKTGQGIQELSAQIISKFDQIYGIQNKDFSKKAGIGTIRQKTLIDNAIITLKNTLSMADKGEPLDLIAPEIRSTVNILGEITGEFTTNDILEAMFSQFCVGK